VRMAAALDAGIDGITLAAGLHLGSFALIEDHPRFRDAKLGIIVSSLRALQLFLKKTPAPSRLPDYVVVEGPLAGGHLGFGMDWAQYDLATIVAESHHRMDAGEQLDIPLIPAGGIFTGSDAVGFLEKGAAAVQVATRASPWPKSAACRETSSRNTSRPAKTRSRSTRSRPPATRCAC
jgi:nitronate monooxygenase